MRQLAPVSLERAAEWNREHFSEEDLEDPDQFMKAYDLVGDTLPTTGQQRLHLLERHQDKLPQSKRSKWLSLGVKEVLAKLPEYRFRPGSLLLPILAGLSGMGVGGHLVWDQLQGPRIDHQLVLFGGAMAAMSAAGAALVMVTTQV